MRNVGSECRCRGGSIMLAGAVFAALLQSCGSKETATLGSVHVKSELIRASEGGTLRVTVEDHPAIAGAEIAIPAGALAQDTTITIGVGDSSIISDNGTPIGPSIDFGPDGTQFSSPVVVTLPYNLDPIANRLRVYERQADGATSIIPGHELTLDPATKTVRVQVRHFTQYQCGNGAEPPPCATSDCGPALGLPNWVCEDGTQGGPTGNCVRNQDGSCGWEINWCPVACDDTRDCGPAPGAAFQCPDGSTADTVCERRSDGSCGWNFVCPDVCNGQGSAGTGTSGGNAPQPGGGGDPSVCRPDCRNGQACPQGSVCDPNSGDCVPDQAPCGNTICGQGEYCCNESCGICAPIGGACTRQVCGGGCDAIGAECPPGSVCDPQTGSCVTTSCSQTSGGTNVCPPGSVCDPQTGTCVPGVPCGNTACSEGEYCCNSSCGICAPQGSACTQQACNVCGRDPSSPPCPPGTRCDVTGACVPEDVGTPCGNNVCGQGEYCCNSSCGICAPQGSVCTQQFCGTCGSDPNAPTCPPDTTCDAASGQCTPICSPQDCGPEPGLANWVCEDGSTGGPTGRCAPTNSTGTQGSTRPIASTVCAWEIIWCPRICDPQECGPQPACPMTSNGGTGAAECRRNTDGTCGWTCQ